MVPLFVGLVGPSGSGKTFSALRLATGMQRISGGDIGGIDTEADRMLHYADNFKFRHLPFGSPFDPLSYLAAVEHFVKKGVKTIIIDSASHMHEGPGGTLEAHETELTRLAGNDYDKRNRMTMMAWQKPKAELRRFLNSILQLKANVIFCFRAKEKIKIVSGQNPKPLGFMPIAGDEMFYEMTASCLLYPNSGGVPSWNPTEMGEKAIIKLPGQFRALFKDGAPLSEATGEALAMWATGVSHTLPASTAVHGTNHELLELSTQLKANGHRTTEARIAWINQSLGLSILSATDLTPAQIARALEVAQGAA